MDDTLEKRTITEWIGFGFIVAGLALLLIEVLQAIGIADGWMDDPLRGAIIVTILGSALIMLEKNKKTPHSEVS